MVKQTTPTIGLAKVWSRILSVSSNRDIQVNGEEAARSYGGIP